MSLNWKALISISKDFYKRAREEFERAISKNDVIGIRDSAEKAWNAVVQATNALILALTNKLPASHFERRRILRGLEKKYADIEKLGILDRYMARFKVLHGETFYEGIIDVEQLKVDFEKVEKYIKDIEDLSSKILKKTTSSS